MRRAGVRRTGVVVAAALVTSVVVPVVGAAVMASADPGGPFVSGVTFPFNGVWLDSADGGHYWDASGNGLCRIDSDGAGGFTENLGTCDVQAKKPTQAVVGKVNADGTSFVYAADMSSKSGGPVRLTFDPAANTGAGGIVAGSGTTLGGLNTVGFFADAGGNFKNSSVSLGPCDQTVGAKTAGTACTALYVGFERSQKIERINNVDKAVAAQSIETISKVTDKRKGVRFGMGIFHNSNGKDDLYIDELGGNGVSLLTDVAQCAPSEGTADPAVINPPVNTAGGCAATIVGGITTNFPQGMAVQSDPTTGNGQFIYVADSPRNGAATVLRYHPDTGLQDVVSKSVNPAYDSLLNPGQSVSTYTFVMGLAVNPHNGDLFIGDDPTFAVLVNPPLNKGHIFTIKGDANHVAPADCVGTAGASCALPPPPSTVTPALYAYGLTAPKGGVTFVPSDDGGHIWAADHSQGLCRMDVVPKAQSLHAYNSGSCDDGTVLGSGGQTAYDDSVVPATTNQHYLYVAQNDHLSPGVIRFTFDPSADNGAGALINGSAVVMAPNAGLNGDKANGLALGPCKPGAPATCKHSLYMGGLLDGFIRRINNPEDDPRVQTVDVVAVTTEQKAGTAGKGINGSMGMIGDNLYLPENQGFTVVRGIQACPTNNQVCGSTPLNIGQFGFIFGSAIGVDPNHGVAGTVYAAISPGAANGTLYQYDVATNTSRIYSTQGQMPPANSAAATVWCTTTCTRPVDPANPPGGVGNFRFAQGIMVDTRADDQAAAPSTSPRTPSPAPAAAVATPGSPRTSRTRTGSPRYRCPPLPAAPAQTCSVTVNCPVIGVRPDLLGAVHHALGRTDQRDLEDADRAIRTTPALPRQPVHRIGRPGQHRKQGRLDREPELLDHHRRSPSRPHRPARPPAPTPRSSSTAARPLWRRPAP